MIYDHLINQVSELVETACYLPENPFGEGIWSNHILEVVKFTEILATESGAERDIAILAALLHDYAGIVDRALYEDHHHHGACMAKSMLIGLGYPADRAQRVSDAILTHRGSKKMPPKTLEARIVANADALAHIYQWQSLVLYAEEKRGLDVYQSRRFVYEKLTRSWQKMHSTIKKLFEPYYIEVIQALSLAA